MNQPEPASSFILPPGFSFNNGLKTSVSIEAQHFTPVDDNIPPWECTLECSKILLSAITEANYYSVASDMDSLPGNEIAVATTTKEVYRLLNNITHLSHPFRGKTFDQH